jgi:hypothetical protein
MRKATVGVIMAIVCSMTAMSCAGKDPKMTLKDFMGLCVSDASDNCRDACDEFASVFVVSYPTAAECRKACDKVAERLNGRDVGRTCDSTLGRAAELCAQYCDKNK